MEGVKLSPGQGFVHFFESAGESKLINQLAYSIDAGFDFNDCQSRLQNAVAATEILDTVIAKLPGLQEPLQVLREASDVSIGESVLASDDDAYAQLLAEFRKSVTPGELPWRVDLIKTSNTQILVITAHALLLDLESMALLVQHILSNTNLDFDEEALQFLDVADWQNEILETNVDRQARQQWQERLDQFVGMADPSIGMPSGNWKSVSNTCSDSIVYPNNQLQSLSEQTDSVKLCRAVWIAVLGRSAKTENLRLMVRHRGRHHEEAAAVLGPMTRMIPCTVPVNTALNFDDFIASIKSALDVDGALLDQYHADTHAWPNSASHCIGFTGVNLPGKAPRDATNGLPACGLGLNVVAGEDKVVVNIVYDPRHVSKPLAERLLQRFDFLLNTWLDTPTVPLSELALVPESERQHIAEYLTDHRSVEFENTVVHAVQAVAEKNPQQIAVVCGDIQLTYADLLEAATRIQLQLKANTSDSGNVVIIGARSAGFVAAMLGVSSAGLTYIPVDSSYPEERIRFVVEDANAIAIICDDTYQSDFGFGDVPQIQIDSRGKLQNGEDLARSSTSILTTPETIAYLIYTSGSTGKPKGVEVTHANLSYSTRARLIEYPLSPGVFLMPSSFAFDSSVAGTYWTLVSGGTLVLPAPGQETDAQALAGVVKRFEVTHTLMLPSLYEAVMKTAAEDDLQTLRVAIVAGEACPESVTGLHFQMLPSTRLYNEYGPTEATVWCTVYEIKPDDTDNRLPIGHAIPGTTLRILDDSQNDVPLAALGELYVVSPGVATGYRHQQTLTAERFVELTDHTGKTQRAYRTGDLVSLNDKGLIEFHGRVDRQVKIRGYRIELEEIEDALRRLPNVEAAAVTVQEFNNSPELVAYFTSRESRVNTDTVLQALSRDLPKQFVPKALSQIAEMPLMPNGKIDYQALPEVAAAMAQRTAAYVAPRNALEEKLQSVYRETLERDNVGINDNFFDIGGHSILATITVARLRQVLNAELPIRLLFDNPTIAALAAALSDNISVANSDLTTNVDETAKASIPARSDKSRGRLSPMQTGIWYLSQLNNASSAYNLQAGFRLKGKLNIDALCQAMETVVNHHAVLRTDIQTDAEGQPFAQIHDWVKVPIDVIELDDDPNHVQEFLSTVATVPVATDKGPLLRVSIAKCGQNQFLLVLVFHHLVAEGWSVATFLEQVSRVYTNQEVALQPPSIDYWDWNQFEFEQLNTDKLAPQLKYWQEQLAGEPTHLEFGSRNTNKAARGGMCGRKISKQLISKLEQLGREQNASLFAVMLAAYQALLQRYTGETDIRIGTPINTRTRSELDQTFGLFINTLILRTTSEKDLSFIELLKRTKETVLDAFSNMDAPLDYVARHLDGSGKNDGKLFQVMFALQNARPMVLDLPDLAIDMIGHHELHSGAGKVDISLVVEPGDNDYEVWLEYDGGTFDAERAHRFLQHYELLLNGLLAEPQASISLPNILTTAERDLQLQTFIDTTVALDTRTAIERVWRQIQNNPNALAVAATKTQYTYSELGITAAKFAQVLLNANVEKSAPIAICIGRKPQLVAAIVGVHLVGACYVPIDPEYPDERINHILNDSQTQVLITDTPQRFADKGFNGRIIDVTQIDSQTAADENLFRWPGADDLAYIVYTSGSTGVPKGVKVKQRGLSNLVAWEQRVYAVNNNDRASMVAGLGFDASVWELWPILAVGASLFQIDDDKRADPLKVYDWLVEKQISITFLPTPLAEVVLDLQVPDKIALRYLFTGGDALHAREWKQLPYTVVNHYGPSENTVIATAGAVDVNLDAKLPPHIGRPIDNVRTYILDDHLQLVPVGVAGELCIAGPMVADGYINDEQQTVDRFVVNPYGDGDWVTLYKTGDRALYNHDGTIEFLGRLDNQVKIRGFRIELGDIESTLTAHEKIKTAAAIVWDVNRDDKRVVAYLVPEHQGEELDSVQMRKYMRAKLPAYMVPTYFITLDALPQTKNGKLDRKALPLPLDAVASQQIQAPETLNEIALAEIWREILSAGQVDRNANFFEIGGNSISAMKVLSAVKIKLGVAVPLRAVALDSLSQIAAYLDVQVANKKPLERKGLRGLVSQVFNR